MFNIGEFARLGGVSARTLRHYDEIGLLRPATVDPGSGYRGYTAAQLGELNRIMALKELGLSLPQVRRLLEGVTRPARARNSTAQEPSARHRGQASLYRQGGWYASRRHRGQDDLRDWRGRHRGPVSRLGTANIVAVVNQLEAQFDQLGILTE